MQHIMISWSKALGSFMVNVYDLRHQLNFLQVAGEHMCVAGCFYYNILKQLQTVKGGWWLVP